MFSFSKYHPKKWLSNIAVKIGILISLYFMLIAIFILMFFPYKLKDQVIQAISDKAQSIAEIITCNMEQAFQANDNIPGTISMPSSISPIAMEIFIRREFRSMNPYEKNASPSWNVSEKAKRPRAMATADCEWFQSSKLPISRSGIVASNSRWRMKFIT